MQATVAHVSFNGQCVDAFQLYAEALGGRIASVSMLVGARQVRHAVLHLDGLTLIGHDRLAEAAHAGEPGHALAINLGCAQRASQAFADLADEGFIVKALQPTESGQGLGLVVDRFGILWTVLTQW